MLRAGSLGLGFWVQGVAARRAGEGDQGTGEKGWIEVRDDGVVDGSAVSHECIPPFTS